MSKRDKRRHVYGKVRLEVATLGIDDESRLVWMATVKKACYDSMEPVDIRGEGESALGALQDLGNKLSDAQRGAPIKTWW